MTKYLYNTSFYLQKSFGTGPCPEEAPIIDQLRDYAPNMKKYNAVQIFPM